MTRVRIPAAAYRDIMLDKEFFEVIKMLDCEKGFGHAVKKGCLRIFSKGLMTYSMMAKGLKDRREESRGLCVYNGKFTRAFTHLASKLNCKNLPTLELDRGALEDFFAKGSIPKQNIGNGVAPLTLDGRAYVFITFHSHIYALAELSNGMIKLVEH